MDLLELSKYLLDEQAAEEYLLEKGVIKTFTKCIRCESEKIGKIRRGKVKCYDCKYEWKQTKGSIVDEVGLSRGKFIALLKMFELEVPAYKLVKLIKIKENKADQGYYLIRKILINQIDKQNEIKNLVFSIDESNKKITVSQFDQSSSAPKLIINRKRKVNNFIELKVEFQGQRINKPSPLLSNFLKELHSRLRSLRKIHYKNIFFYIKEVEFRFNNREKDIFTELLKRISIKK